MVQKTFINNEGSSKFNAATIGMLYTYWHEISKDGITHLTIDEQKEIEELVSLLPSNTVLHSISVQQLSTGEFAYTYVFKRSCTPYPTNFQASKASSAAMPKFNALFHMVNDLTEYAGHYYITPIPNTDIVLGTFIIG